MIRLNNTRYSPVRGFGQTPNQLRILQWGGLFERWVDPHLRDVVVANQHHEAVLFWDLCNEPYFSGAASDSEKKAFSHE